MHPCLPEQGFYSPVPEGPVLGGCDKGSRGRVRAFCCCHQGDLQEGSVLIKTRHEEQRMRILFAFRRQSPQDNRVQILVSGRTPTLLLVTFAVKLGSSASTSLLFAIREPILEC